jgi:cbb3-type cytochrome oxidase maturation protein
MNILIMTIPISLTLGLLFLLFYLAAVSDDQFEDLDTPGQLPLSDDEDSAQDTVTINEELKKNKKTLSTAGEQTGE